MSLAVGLACLALLARYRGALPRFAQAPVPPPEEGEVTTLKDGSKAAVGKCPV